MTKEQLKANIKEGWRLNPNEGVVNGILRGIERNGGECPCAGNPYRGTPDGKCPCRYYLVDDKCECTLYIKKSQEDGDLERD